MGADKAELKRAGALEVGARIDQQVDAIKERMRASVGQQQGLKIGVGALEATMAQVDKDRDAGTVTQDEAIAIKRYLGSTTVTMQGLGERAVRELTLLQGQLQGMEGALHLAGGYVEQQNKRIEEFAKPDGDETPRLSVVGKHPGSRAEVKAKARKIVQEKAKARKKKAKAAVKK